jgi:hypothetical protein
MQKHSKFIEKLEILEMRESERFVRSPCGH